MADAAPIVHIGENSPEEVAYKMMLLIARAEGKSLNSDGKNPVTRNWVLSTYAQCRSLMAGNWTAADAIKERPLIE